MADIALKDGTPIEIDVGMMTVADWRLFVSQESTRDQEDEIIGKCTGMTGEEVKQLPWNTWRAVVKEIVRQCREPLADPN